MPKDLRGGFGTYWTRMGQGQRKALMLHCSMAHSGAWKGVARRLDGVLDMLAYDLPGYGRSDAWDDRGDFQTVSTGMAADLLDELDGPADIIGHSYGATVALRLAVEQPERVRSLVLIEPVFFAVALADQPDLMAQHDAELAEYAAAVAVGDMERAAREFTRLWGDGRSWDSVPEAQRRTMAAQIPLIEAETDAIYHDSAAVLSGGGLERIAAPVLLMEGGASPVYIAAINAGLARCIPRAERCVIEGAGHMVPITHPDQVAAEIARFLEGAAG